MGIFNQFVMRKNAALLIPPLITTVLFYVGVVFYGLIGGVGFMLAGMLLGYVIGWVVLKNPFSDMLEGAGIMVLNIDSTGIIRPFIMKVNSPYLEGKIGGKNRQDIFDRDVVQSMALPVKVKEPATLDKQGNLKIDIDSELYNQGRFGLFHYPVLIWNDQIKSLLTKEFLSNRELEAFSVHGVLYLNRKVEEMTSLLRDFGRYVVELTKPQGNFFTSKIFLFILIGGLILLALLFAPLIFEFLAGFTATGVDAVSGTNAPVTPR